MTNSTKSKSAAAPSMGDYICNDLGCGWQSTDRTRPLSRGLKVGCPKCEGDARFVGSRKLAEAPERVWIHRTPKAYWRLWFANYRNQGIEYVRADLASPTQGVTVEDARCTWTATMRVREWATSCGVTTEVFNSCGEQRCVKCGHSGKVNERGFCQHVRIKAYGEDGFDIVCSCQCVFAATDGEKLSRR